MSMAPSNTLLMSAVSNVKMGQTAFEGKTSLKTVNSAMATLTVTGNAFFGLKLLVLLKSCVNQ